MDSPGVDAVLLDTERKRSPAAPWMLCALTVTLAPAGGRSETAFTALASHSGVHVEPDADHAPSTVTPGTRSNGPKYVPAATYTVGTPSVCARLIPFWIVAH